MRRRVCLTTIIICCVSSWSLLGETRAEAAGVSRVEPRALNRPDSVRAAMGRIPNAPNVENPRAPAAVSGVSLGNEPESDGSSGLVDSDVKPPRVSLPSKVAPTRESDPVERFLVSGPIKSFIACVEKTLKRVVHPEELGKKTPPFIRWASEAAVIGMGWAFLGGLIGILLAIIQIRRLGRWGIGRGRTLYAIGVSAAAGLVGGFLAGVSLYALAAQHGPGPIALTFVVMAAFGGILGTGLGLSLPGRMLKLDLPMGLAGGGLAALPLLLMAPHLSLPLTSGISVLLVAVGVAISLYQAEQVTVRARLELRSHSDDDRTGIYPLRDKPVLIGAGRSAQIRVHGAGLRTVSLHVEQDRIYLADPASSAPVELESGTRITVGDLDITPVLLSVSIQRPSRGTSILSTSKSDKPQAESRSPLPAHQSSPSTTEGAVVAPQPTAIQTGAVTPAASLDATPDLSPVSSTVPSEQLAALAEPEPSGTATTPEPASSAGSTAGGMALFHELLEIAVKLAPGSSLTAEDLLIPFIVGDRVLAEVVARSDDPTLLGLRNSDVVDWVADNAGKKLSVQGGKVIPLEIGKRIRIHRNWFVVQVAG